MEPYYKNKNCKLYQCDNLKLLNSLPDNYIDLIYCDILYNTGRKFNDYDDNLGAPQEATMWYEPRLLEMKRVLKDTGSIYLHMDYRLVHYMKVKMDEIFGINNFQNHIVWCYSGLSATKTAFVRQHDDILFYTKSKKYNFNYKDIRIDRVRKLDKSSGVGLSESSHSMTDEELEEKNAVGKVPRDWWDDICRVPQIHAENLHYDTQKPQKLLNRIISASSNRGEIVADFFMGCGSTGESALKLDRKFIGCDIGDRACAMSKERLNAI